jgi:hypothetical protein
MLFTCGRESRFSKLQIALGSVVECFVGVRRGVARSRDQ